MKFLKPLCLRLPAVFVMCVSWYLSSQERVPMPGFRNSDKLVHFVCFGMLAVCWSLWFSRASWHNFRAGTPWRNAALCVLFTSVYGAVDEFHQSFTPGRCAGADDWLADTLGAALGAAACIIAAGWANAFTTRPSSDKIEGHKGRRFEHGCEGIKG
jgi:VanZ family protein